MNKAKLQTQTGVGRLVTLISSAGSQPGSLLICCKLAPYVLSLLLHMNEWKEGGWRWARVWISMFPLWSSDWGRRAAVAIQMSIMCSASEGGETMLVTVGDRDSWLSHSPLLVRWHAAPTKRKGKCGGGKKAHLWLIKTERPGTRQQTIAMRKPICHVRQCWLCQSSSLLFCPPSICPYSSHPHQHQGHRRLSAKPSNLSVLSFLPPRIWIWKGVSLPLTQSKTITLMTFGSHLIY